MSTFFFRPWVKTQKLSIGDSSNVLTLAEAADTAMEVYTTSASVDTEVSVQPIYMKSVMTGVGGVGGRACFHLSTAVKLGSWANALKGYLEFGSGGGVKGLGSAILAEMKLPPAVLPGGSYGVSEIELVTQSGGTTGGNPVAFQWMQVSGNQAATDDWENNGYFMIVKGLKEESGNIFHLSSGLTKKGSLRILIGSTPYYIMLASSPTG